MCRKQIIIKQIIIISSKNKKIFHDHPVQSEQNKPISGHIQCKKNNKTNN